MLLTGADWPVGQFGRIPEGPIARREKVRGSMETFAFLSISAHFLQFVGRFGQIVPGLKNLAIPPLVTNVRIHLVYAWLFQELFSMICLFQ